MNTERIDTVADVALGVAILAIVAVPGLAAAMDTPPQPERSVVVGVQGPGNDGQLAVVAPNGSYTHHRGDAGSYHDVTQINESYLLATYAVGEDERCGTYDPPCARTGVRLIDRETRRIVRQWSMPVRTIGNSEVHDAELVDGRLLVADMDRERVMLVHWNGSVVWEWRAAKYYDTPPDPTTTDWLHINDVDRLAEGRYLVSVRNANQLVIVERGEGVVEVINSDRSVRTLRGQHNPQWLGEGRVLVADSSNDRVVELARQPNGTWTPVWSVGRAAGQRFAWPRDADRLPNGDTLVTDSRNHRVVRVDADGEAVAVWNTPKLPYDAELRGGRERVGGAPHQRGPIVPARGEGGGWVLRKAVVGLHHTLGLPGWVAWWQVAGVLAAVGGRGLVDGVVLLRRR